MEYILKYKKKLILAELQKYNSHSYIHLTTYNKFVLKIIFNAGFHYSHKVNEEPISSKFAKKNHS